MPSSIEVLIYVFLIFSLYMWLTEDHSCKIPDFPFDPSSPDSEAGRPARRAPCHSIPNVPIECRKNQKES